MLKVNSNQFSLSHTGIYLTDIIFCREGNPAQRASPLDPNLKLLNFHRYSQLARILNGECLILCSE